MLQTDPFGEDYQFISASYLTSERTKREAQFICDVLDLKPADTIVDVGCGGGRMSIALAEMGLNATGLDINVAALELARRSASARGVSVQFFDHDYRQTFPGRYRAAISWHTSLGLSSDSEAKRALSNIAACLQTGGCLAIDHINRDLAIGNFQRCLTEERDNSLMVDRAEYDPIDNRVQRERTFVTAGIIKRATFNIRLFTCSELRSWLVEAGFSEVRFLGTDGEAFRRDSQRMITIASK